MAKKEDNVTYTPMIEQYLEVKSKHPDVIIMYRIGDFYEMFFDDAKIASKELQLFLTGKSAGQKDRVPMCGIPHHAYLAYVQKLLDNGHKVGIVEQMEDPKLAKGLVKRDVIQIITPGANLEIEGSDNNYLAALIDFKFTYALAFADLSTGEIDVMNVSHSYQDVVAQLVNYDAKEVIVSTSMDAALINAIKTATKICLTYFNNDEGSLSYEPLYKYVKDERQMTAVAKLMNYLHETQKRDLDYFKPAVPRVLTKVLALDHSSRVNLELTKSISGEGAYGSLYWLLNHCQTPMGERLLKTYINEPSSDQTEIEERLDKVQTLIENFLIRGDLKDQLAQIYDLDRLIARVGFDSCSGKEMLQLKASLKVAPLLKESLAKLNSPHFNDIASGLSDFTDLINLLEKAIANDCPPTIKEGGIFKLGYDSKLDEVIKMATDGKAWLVDLETKEKEKTGIHTLKVGYSKIFGYYIEVSNGALSQVKPEFGYIRKQTMTTGERFITEELKNAESQILHAEEARVDMEYKMFQELREKVKTYTEQIQLLSQAVSQLDVIVSLAEVSAENGYIRPTFNREKRIEILKARHPVIEKAMPEKAFVANDYVMPSDLEVLIITGPNMGGKSTYMREFALLVIMAQLGCFVPAEKADLYVFDAIFTRIGASDDLIKGESTFMVEMAETNRALRNATQNSLLIFDEIGRGTATYDGMALAQSIIEYIVKDVHAKTLFSTHYHEITGLVQDMPTVNNVHVSVKEEGQEITFLYKVEPGPMDKSYGINVAKLAGLPSEILVRAEEILARLEAKKINYSELKTMLETPVKESGASKEETEALEAIKSLDPLTMSPMEALNFLFELKKKVK
ncbi:MAG: DNA mismatch repair protein MutS [Bacilli bacterium]|jgi:DNA mismatch repair protein MutS|nr:DNA mismatch repair protein MutS [Bacilli bacterium]